LFLNTIATLVGMTLSTVQIASRPRDYVAVNGPDAVSYVDRMVSNDTAALEVGASCEALLLTAKARIIAPLVVLRRTEDGILLLTEPGLGEAVRAVLVRMRLRSNCSIEVEAHSSTIVLGAAEGGIACRDYGRPAVELLDAEPPADAEPMEPEELERLRILAGTPRWGRELDDRVLPAEAGLEKHAISFTKGCYPGQEPIARLHHRGHPNRTLRVLALPGEVPAYDAELTVGGKVVGRVTSAAADSLNGVVALGYVRREIAAEDDLALGDRIVRQL
jgi:tRNA-modifying protein YgfZ